MSEVFDVTLVSNTVLFRTQSNLFYIIQTETKRGDDTIRKSLKYNPDKIIRV